MAGNAASGLDRLLGLLLGLLLLLLAALPLWGCGPDRQAPLTAGEADRFVHDNRLVQERGREVRDSLGIMDLREKERLVGRAKREKSVELGWDPARYDHVFQLFLDALRMRGYRESLARLEREMGQSPSPSKLEQLRNTHAYMEKNMRELDRHRAETSTAAERTFVHERLASLSEPFDESAPVFHWVE
ncbi:hypothetical protein [Pseudodesulfovibrio mercurii]|uniref:hypothetical protein n=1 Tax=Pseudodesulfovibrio mercurii TaxID=641491 RepID=UPI000319F75C|nr:hypothetical protein [Pseudodesulfovibrio mercurii]